MLDDFYPRASQYIVYSTDNIPDNIVNTDI